MELRITLDQLQLKQLTKQIQQNAENFLPAVAKEWRWASEAELKRITADQLSGRRGNSGLYRRSGEASRAMISTTKKGSNNVVTKIFMRAESPARKYLPIHDASWKGSRTILPKRGKYLRFQTKDKKWHSVESVTIPERIDIIGEYSENFGFDAEFAVRKLLKRMSKDIN